MGNKSRIKRELREERHNSEQFRTERFKNGMKTNGIILILLIAAIIFFKFIAKHFSPLDYSSLTDYIFYLPSLIFLLLSVFQIYIQRSIQSWIETTCIIEARDIKSTKNGTSYYPYIYFRYKVNGIEYLSNRVNYGRMYSSHEKAYMKVQEFEFGKKYKCYYNPQKPKEAVLEKDFQLHTFFVSLMLSLVSLLFPLIIYWHKK
jgi:hypothetical protein